MLIKNKVDKLEELQSEEINTLLDLISNLHGELKANHNNNSNNNRENNTNKNNKKNEKNKLEKTQKKGEKRIDCVKCNNINPENSVYCNRCGEPLSLSRIDEGKRDTSIP